MKKLLPIFIALVLGLCSLNAKNTENTENTRRRPPYPKVKVQYGTWGMILKTSINKHGDVDYKRIKKNERLLDKFLNRLSNTKIDDTWTEENKIAYWINVYNAFTIKLILDNYPTSSIKNIKKPWSQKFFKINGVPMSLGHVEHEILRKEFNEPRIHFAINCASRSCPRIVQVPYTGKNLNSLLDRQTKEYINNPMLNVVNNDYYKLSKLFSWFSKDFKKAEGTVKDFINKYSDVTIKSQKNKGFFEYNWDLNTNK